MPIAPCLSGTVNGQALNGFGPQDLYDLAKIIHGEARGECFEGMVAVGAVVLNRVAHRDFPDTIQEVIHQPRQFSSVDDGQFFMEPDEASYRAALAAIQGYDPTDGCLFFYNPVIATARWSFQQQTDRTIGNHRFTR